MKYIYVCGPTVYNKVHIGNMKPIVTFDLFLRGANFFEKKYIFLHNLTDIDDKIIKRSLKENLSEIQISEKYANFYLKMLKEYSVLKPDYIEKVTENIKIIIEYINDLIKKNAAYIKNGSVYFDTTKYSEYGKISNLNMEKTYESDDEFKNEKNNLHDFVLWKKTKEGITWNSPWSKGRPGWHTECSALIRHIFKKEQIDIHGGGIDLIFPHNENENIQNIALHNVSLAKKWIHIGHVNWDSKKMSKSLNNFILADEFLKEYGGDSFRTLILNSNYSSPLNINLEMLNSNKKITDKYNVVYNQALILILRNNINEKKYNFKKKLEEFANYLESFEFSKLNFELNKEIKLFNSVLSFKQAILIKQIFQLIGFKFSTKKLTQKNLDLYLNWEDQKNKKNYKDADKLLFLLKKKKIA